ncbi:MAG: hypothetical protein K2H67_00995 [Treponemataceae bacterium]|nr:hypothetical protein [Treponemataceae bacterium]
MRGVCRVEINPNFFIKEKSMKNKMYAALAAMVLATAAFAADFPSYLIMRGSTTVFAHGNDMPAELVIPEGVTGIWTQAFYGCTGLTIFNITISV